MNTPSGYLRHQLCINSHAIVPMRTPCHEPLYFEESHTIHCDPEPITDFLPESLTSPDEIDALQALISALNIRATQLLKSLATSEPQLSTTSVQSTPDSGDDSDSAEYDLDKIRWLYRHGDDRAEYPFDSTSSSDSDFEHDSITILRENPPNSPLQLTTIQTASSLIPPLPSTILRASMMSTLRNIFPS